MFKESKRYWFLCSHGFFCPFAAPRDFFRKAPLFQVGEWPGGAEFFASQRQKTADTEGQRLPLRFYFKASTMLHLQKVCEWEVERSLECCMCSYAALIQNTSDTLLLERGCARGLWSSCCHPTMRFFWRVSALIQTVVVECEDGEPVSRIAPCLEAQSDAEEVPGRRHLQTVSATPIVGFH